MKATKPEISFKQKHESTSGYEFHPYCFLCRKTFLSSPSLSLSFSDESTKVRLNMYRFVQKQKKKSRSKRKETTAKYFDTFFAENSHAMSSPRVGRMARIETRKANQHVLALDAFASFKYHHTNLRVHSRCA